MAFTLFDSVHLPAGQVFGNNSSAQKFKPIAKARKKLVEHLFNDQNLVLKHKNILDNVKFSEKPNINTEFVQSKPCLLRKELRDKSGNLSNPKLFMFRDDSLMVKILPRIPQLLAASIES